MRKLFLSAVSLLMLVHLPAQSTDQYFNAAEVARIEGILASDAMQGRRTFTPGIEKAAAFICR